MPCLTASIPRLPAAGDGVKAFLIESLLVTESTLLWVAIILFVSVIVFLLALWHQTTRLAVPQVLRSPVLPRFHGFRCP